MADFPIDIEVDPAAAIRGIESIESELTQLEAAGEKASKKLQASVDNAFKARSTNGGEFADAYKALGAGSNRGQSELEGLISGFNETAVAASKARSAFTETGNAQSFLSKATSGLKGELGSLAISYASLAAAKALIIETVELGDEYTNLQNKLRQVTSSDEELARVQEKLFNVAQASRQSFESVVTIYSRTANAAQALGISQGKVADFTELLSKSLATSGANSTEAAQAMIQLSQGIGRGTLQGQDLKAVLEDVPAIGQIIAKGLHVSFGELQKLGAEGKITSEKIIDAFIAARGEIETKFAKSVPTAGQAFTQIRNELLLFAGEVTNGLGPALQDIVGVVHELLQGLKPVITGVIDLGRNLINFHGDGFITFLKNVLGNLGDILGLINKVIAAKEHLDNLGGGGTNVSTGKKEKGAVGKGLDFLDKYVNPLNVGSTYVVGGVNKAEDFSKTSPFVGGQSNIGYAAEEGRNRMIDLINDQADADRKAAEEREKLKQKEDDEAISAAKAALAGVSSAQDLKHVKEDLKKSTKDLDDETKDYIDHLVEAAEEEQKRKQGLQALLDSIDPVAKAQRDLLDVKFALNTAAEKGELSSQGEQANYDAAAAAVARYEKQHREALDPLGDYNDKISEQTSDLALTDRQLKLLQKQREIENDLEKKGVTITEDLTLKIADQVGALQAAQDAHDKRAKAAREGASASKRFLDELFPVIQAEKDLHSVERLLEAMVRKRKLTQDEANEALDRYKRKHEDLLDPVATLLRNLDEQIRATNALTQEQKDQLALEKFIDEQRQKGIVLTREEIQLIKAKQKALDEAQAGGGRPKTPTGPEGVGDAFEAYQSQKQSIEDDQEQLFPLLKTQRELTAVTEEYYDAVARGIITQEEADAALTQHRAAADKAIQDAYDQFLELKAAGGDVDAALKLGFDSFKQHLLDVTDVSQFMINTFDNAVKGVIDIFDALGDAIGDAIDHGKADWKAFGDAVKGVAASFTQAVLHDLEEIFIKLAVIKILGSISPGGKFGAAASTIPLLGFASGGSLLVGGNTGTDNNVFAARVSRNERITIETPEQVRARERGFALGAAAQMPAIYNVYDPGSLIDQINTPRGRRSLVNFFRQNPDLVRSLRSG